ncbi:MAG TPA: lysoplasmalogenase family protein [Anaerolineae bacterium]|nr:lysoplasmalogenase family protein [Anaerolineae bacterium]HOQ99201.1 lysoplasmalogenase family protein [Anaerolineae bacterium]HPL27961.1 lysoplasmalogenase family protein [Anaerolineae bacterium]
MAYHLLPVPLSIAGIAWYLIARNRNDLKRVAVIQPLLTLLSIAVAALSLLGPRANPAYTGWILAGLILAFAADIFNIDMTSDKTVMAALVIFVLAYLTYGIGLTVFSGFQRQDLVSGLLLFLVYLALVRYLWPGLGSFRIPILIYGLIMPLMVNRAISTFFGSTFSTTQAILLTAGTSMLYLGDIEYGIHRFRRPIKYSVGPILYAGGQLLVALSCAYF